MNQNIKIESRTQKSSKNSNLTIIIANTKYAINSVPTQNVKAGNNIIQYKPIGKFSNDERTLLNQSLREGYIYINEAYTLLQKAKAYTLEKAEAILGELEESSFEALLANIQQIQDKILSPKLVVLKEDYLDTEKDHILASVKENDSYTFTVYENFFDKKEFKDNRAGVIIHEICHLCDIEEGADMYDINSAECLKNIILHLNDILSLDEIQAEYAKKQEPQERNDDILTYDPDQPRVPAGSPEGGQWTSGGSSSSSKGKESQASESKDTKKSSSGAVSIKDDKYSSVKYKSYEKESGIKVSFTNADKANPQNAKDFDIKKRNYKDDPEEGVVINRSYARTNEKGCWISTTIKLEGFEKRKDYTILIEASYSYKTKDGKNDSETVLVAYDVKSDDEGCVILERVGILSYEEENSNIEDMNIILNLHSKSGRVEDNFGNDHLVNKKNTGVFAKYLPIHSETPNFDYNNNIQKENQGGVLGEMPLEYIGTTPLCNININTKISK